jgi:hypothetical protein
MARSIHTPFGVSDGHTMVVSTLRNLDPLSSEETRIQRKASGAEHREGSAHRGEMDVHPGLGRMQDGQAQLRDRDERAGERRPQTDQQQDGGSRRHHFQEDGGRRSGCQEPRVHQRNGGGSA